MRIFYFLPLLFLCNSRLSAQACNPQDSLQLINFFNSTNGPNWNINWDFTQPVSQWQGVYLNNQGRVRNLSLSGRNLTGTLPNLDLPDLKELHLANNAITGSIPNFDLPSLGFMVLFNNQLSGPIPDFNLPNLTEFNLSENQLSGPIPNFNLPNLSSLNLEQNQLSGSLPNFDLPKIKHLSVAINQLTGSIPNFNLPNLATLGLDVNQLSGSIPDFDLPNLENFSAGINQLTGSLPDFSKLPNLEWLNFQENQLSGSVPKFELPKLVSLKLHNNQLDGNIPSLDLPELKFLQLENNQLKGAIPGFNLPKLSSLHLQNNQLSGKIPDFGFDMIYSLFLQNNRFTFDGMEELVKPGGYGFFDYAPQANIPMQVAGNALSVSAGGTLANNTFIWYKNNAVVATKTGDSTFVADQSGTYRCHVLNSLLSSNFEFDSLVLVSEPYDFTVSADEILEELAFQVSPNPISENQPLQIFLETDFFGKVKIELLALDGRVLRVFEKEKTSENQVFQIENLPAENSFFVRISDEKRRATRLVFKF